MANVFDNFVKAYDQTVNTDDRIKRGRYADYADWLRLNNTFSNDEVSRNYNQLIAGRYGQLTPSVVNEANRTDELRGLEFPARRAVTGDTAAAIMANTRPFVDSNIFSAQANASTAQNNAVLAERNRLFNLANPDAAQGPAVRAQNYAQNQFELRALAGNSPDEIARVFGGTRDDYVQTPRGWTMKDGSPVMTSADKQLYQGYRAGNDAMRTIDRAFAPAGQAPAVSGYGPGPWADPTSEPGGFYNPNASVRLAPTYPTGPTYTPQGAEAFVSSATPRFTQNQPKASSVVADQIEGEFKAAYQAASELTPQLKQADPTRYKIVMDRYNMAKKAMDQVILQRQAEYKEKEQRRALQNPYTTVVR